MAAKVTAQIKTNSHNTTNILTPTLRTLDMERKIRVMCIDPCDLDSQGCNQTEHITEFQWQSFLTIETAQKQTLYSKSLGVSSIS